jgi:hypothetical protein
MRLEKHTFHNIKHVVYVENIDNKLGLSCAKLRSSWG